MQFAYDPEMLMAEIKKREGIWDPDHCDYRAKNIKARLWQEVVRELVSMNEVNMTKSEMRELELQLQKKWKSLRDCFHKYVSNPYKFKRPYIYSKQLQFLLKDKSLPPPFPKRKSIQVESQAESSESDVEESKPKNSWVPMPRKKIKLQKKEQESDNDSYTADNYSFEVATAIESLEGTKAPETHNEFAFASVDTKIDSDDPDKMFLISLLPHFKSIPEEFRLNVKMDLLQVLRVANESTTKLKY